MQYGIRFDWAINNRLLSKDNFVILEGFFSELFDNDVKIEKILDNKEGEPPINIISILVQNTNGKLMIVELYNVYNAEGMGRVFNGTSKKVVDDTVMGIPYSDISKVVTISIVHIDFNAGQDYLYHRALRLEGREKKDLLKLRDEDIKSMNTLPNGKIVSEDYLINLSKFDGKKNDTIAEWVNFIKNQEIIEGTKAKGLQEATKIFDITSLSEEEKIAYNEHLAMIDKLLQTK